MTVNGKPEELFKGNAYAVYVIAEDVEINRGDSLERHESQNSQHPRYYQANIFLWTEAEPRKFTKLNWNFSFYHHPLNRHEQRPSRAVKLLETNKSFSCIEIHRGSLWLCFWLKTLFSFKWKCLLKYTPWVFFSCKSSTEIRFVQQRKVFSAFHHCRTRLRFNFRVHLEACFLSFNRTQTFATANEWKSKSCIKSQREHWYLSFQLQFTPATPPKRGCSESLNKSQLKF